MPEPPVELPKAFARSMPVKSLVTRSTLTSGLQAAGVAQGDTILVHTGLSKLGYVPGAAQTVVDGLIDVVGRVGTIAMPTFSGDHSDPGEWRHPQVPSSWVDRIRLEMPGYQAAFTPTRKMGVVSEYFRTCPRVVRSPHPQSSFSALGRNAAALASNHPLDFRFGPTSPLGALLKVGGKVLLLGAPPQTCSFFYLTQHLMPENVEIEKRAPVDVNGKTKWRTYRDVRYPNGWFNDAMAVLLDTGVAVKFQIGDADCHLFDTCKAFPAVVDWRLSML